MSYALKIPGSRPLTRSDPSLSPRASRGGRRSARGHLRRARASITRRMEVPADSARYGGRLAGRSVFVTGAYGFVGGWLTRALLERGARVSVLRRRPRTGCVLEL